MGKEVGNLTYFVRSDWERRRSEMLFLTENFVGKNSISDISVRFTNFVVCTHLFLVNIASFFLVNAKISCQIL